MIGLVFLHGWGFGPEVWSALAALAEERPTAVLNAGYFSAPQMALPPNPDGWVGVGHSLGFARLLAMNLPWRALVGIGGFLRFCQKADRPTGTPRDMIEAMISRLDVSPQEVLTRFHKRCGHANVTQAKAAPQGLARLRSDLELLRDLDLAPPQHPLPALFIQAEDDRIVPLELAREAQALLPGSTLDLLGSGGHALPLTRPQDCQRLIQGFLNDLC
jgi:pimeloyl-[acyl-carrier protein] methyl ester esterase